MRADNADWKELAAEGEFELEQFKQQLVEQQNLFKQKLVEKEEQFKQQLVEVTASGWAQRKAEVSPKLDWSFDPKFNLLAYSYHGSCSDEASW